MAATLAVNTDPLLYQRPPPQFNENEIGIGVPISISTLDTYNSANKCFIRKRILMTEDLI